MCLTSHSFTQDSTRGAMLLHHIRQDLNSLSGENKTENPLCLQSPPHSIWHIMLRSMDCPENFIWILFTAPRDRNLAGFEFVGSLSSITAFLHKATEGTVSMVEATVEARNWHDPRSKLLGASLHRWSLLFWQPGRDREALSFRSSINRLLCRIHCNDSWRL